MSTNRISASSYVKVYTTGVPLTIDLRTPAEHQSEHIEGCVTLPIADVSPLRFRQTLERSGFEKGPVYLLCQSGKRAEVAADKLKDVFKGDDGIELIIIEGGLNAVKQNGAKTKLGTRTSVSIERQVRIASGSIAFVGILLGHFFHSFLFIIPLAICTALIFSGLTDVCSMSRVIAHMPWNRR